ncbi:hypothetical protein ABPG74_019081 [Tetrahymena malaccensis]
MYQEQDSESLKKLQKIAQQLEQNKQLRVINLDAGKGSYGQVVIAEHLQQKSHHAVKIISIFDGVDQVSQQKLIDAKKEALFLKNINHQNIVKYYDEFQIGFNYFIVMEKCEKNLQQLIEDFKNQATEIPKQIFVNFACQILSAINYLHDQKQMLRDLSLRNILIDSENQIKLCDFGLAKQVQDELTSSLMLTSFPKGAPFYYPPELFEQFQNNLGQNKKGYVQSFNGDIWAFGICLYALAGASLEECSQLKSKGYQKREYLGESLNSILSQILSLDPSQRPHILKLIEVFEGIKKQIWTSDGNQNLYKQYLEKMQANQQYLAYQFISVYCQIQQKNEEQWSYLGYTQYELKFFSEAIKSYQKCLEINPKKDSYYQILGIFYKAKGMLDEAIKSYQKCLEINPKKDSCYYNLGIAYYDKGMLDEAIKSYQKCLEINPKDDSCYGNLGIAYQAKGMLDEAIKSYQKCLEINPKDDSCYFNLGNAYQAKGMLDEAIKSYQKCLEINPKLDSCYNNLGSAYDDKGMLDEAIKSYQKCLEINPKDDCCYNNLGQTYYNKGMLDEAIKSYQKCLEINPKKDSCYNKLGNAYQAKGMLDEAIKSYQKCLEINPKNDNCYYNLGIAYKAKGMLDEAIKSYQKCLLINPNHKNCLNNLKIALGK